MKNFESVLKSSWLCFAITVMMCALLPLEISETVRFGFDWYHWESELRTWIFTICCPITSLSYLISNHILPWLERRRRLAEQIDLQRRNFDAH